MNLRKDLVQIITAFFMLFSLCVWFSIIIVYRFGLGDAIRYAEQAIHVQFWIAGMLFSLSLILPPFLFYLTAPHIASAGQFFMLFCLLVSPFLSLPPKLSFVSLTPQSLCWSEKILYAWLKLWLLNLKPWLI